MAARRKQSVKSRGPAGAKRRPAPRTAKRSAKRAARKPAPKPAARGRARRTALPDPMGLPAPNGRTVPSGIGVRAHHTDFTSHDVAGIRRFYTEVLGFANHEFFPEQGYLSVYVTPVSSLGFMAPVAGAPPESWRPPGEPNLYFFVENVDRAHAALVARGVPFDQAPQDMPWGHRVAHLRDPEGRRVCLAQILGR